RRSSDLAVCSAVAAATALCSRDGRTTSLRNATLPPSPPVSGERGWSEGEKPCPHAGFRTHKKDAHPAVALVGIIANLSLGRYAERQSCRKRGSIMCARFFAVGAAILGGTLAFADPPTLFRPDPLAVQRFEKGYRYPQA